MADSDSTLKILIQLGVIGKEDVAAVKDLLQQTGEAGAAAGSEMTESMPENLAAWKNYSKTLGGAGEEAEGFQLKGRELNRVMGELNRIVPGAGEAFKGFREILTGGGGEIAVFCLAIQAATLYWNLYAEAAANAAAATGAAFDAIRTSTAEARTELENFNKEMEKASKSKDPEADKLAHDRAILEAQFKAKKELLKLDEEGELETAKTPADKLGIRKKYAGLAAGLESQHEGDDLNLLNTTLGGLTSEIKKLQDQRSGLETDKLDAAHKIEFYRKQGADTAGPTQELRDVLAKLAEVNGKIIAAQEKATKYGGESDTAGGVHGINDFERSAASNRTISKAVMEGVDPAQHGAQLTGEQGRANLAMTQLFSQFHGGVATMTAILKHHLNYSTTQQQEIEALKNALATLQAQSRSGGQNSR